MSQSPAKAWERIPVDDIGYFSAASLLKKTDRQLQALTKKFEKNRYTGWRNEGNLWRFAMGFDLTHDKTVIDYGCGFGIEALQFARNGNAVIVADINEASINLAARVLHIHGYDCQELLVSSPEQELPLADIFYAAGSLHHVPQARAVLERAYESCNEARLLLYSDLAWRSKMKRKPSPTHHGWLRAMDDVGDYADWYDAKKVERLNEGLFKRISTAYVGHVFLAARLNG